MPRPAGAKPWWRTPGLLLSGATLGLMLGLGTLRHSASTQTKTPTPKAAASKRAPATDPHENPNWFLPETEKATFSIRKKPELVVELKPIKRCLSCHKVPDLPVAIAGRIRNKSRSVRNLLGKKNVHYDLDGSLVRFDTALESMTEEKYERARTDLQGIRFFLSAFASEAERRHTLSHELIHFHSNHPDHMLYEPWANIGALLLEGHQNLRLEELQPSNGYYLGALQRAVLLGENPARPKQLESNRTPGQTYESFCRVSGYAQPQDLRELKDLYRESMQAYQSDDAFWDTASWSFQHPMLIFDAMIARRLVRQKNPAVLAELKHAKAVKENIHNMKQYGRKKAPALNAQGILEFNYARPDLRAVIHAGRKDQDAQAVDAAYYAAIYRHFFSRDKSGRIALRKSAVEKKDLRAVLSWKKSHLEFVARPFEAMQKKNPHLRILGRVGDVLDYSRQRGQEHEKALKALR